MTDTSSAPGGELQLALCGSCGGYSFPAAVYGCSHCGTDAASLRAVPLPQSPRLLNFVTVHAELAPGLPVPCVIGEVQLAPGLVEEALVDVSSEDALQLGMALQPRAVSRGETVTWRFAPTGEGA